MTDKLLQYYEKELAFLQQSASDFARKHPGAASGLQITEDAINDPLVNQLMSGVAYMNARIHQKIDDDLPELSDAILDTLYPHYLRPIPSLAVVQCPPQEDLDKVHHLPRGTELQTASDAHDVCKFTTCYPVNIAPITVENVKLVQKPFIAPGSSKAVNADAVLKIQLKTHGEIPFEDLTLEQLRFFLKGPKQHTFRLYDLLLTHCELMVVAKGDTETQYHTINKDCIAPVGFEADEAMLPYTEQSFMGYRLLSEYFALPEKFLFFDIKNWMPSLPELLETDTLSVYIYLKVHDEELEHQVSPTMFALNCTPAINLFEHSADPIRITHTEYTYPIEPDARHHRSMEVYSIDQVASVNDRGEKTYYQPFYGVSHKLNKSEKTGFWFSKRRPITEGEHGNEHASEVDIGVVDLNFDPFELNNQALEIKLHCSNRNLPKKLPTSNGQPFLSLVQGSAPVEAIRCLVPPTESIRPPQGRKAFWRLISHLNLNHLSLSQGASSQEALKEILRLYDFKDSASTRNKIESIQEIKTRTITAPIQVDGTIALCRGTEVILTLDPQMLNGASVLAFANLLNHFFGLYCSINSFTKLSVKLSGKDGVLYKWPPRAGEKALV